VKTEYSYLSVDAFLKNYQLLKTEELKRLIAVCHRFRDAYCLKLEPKDLMNEALTGIIAGHRKIPKGIVLVAGIAQVIKSIANDLVTSASNKAWQLEVAAEESDSVMSEVSVFSLSPEEELLEAQEAADVSEKVMAIFRFFENDADVLSLLRSITDGLKARDIVESTFNGNQVKYDSTRKRLMRGIARMKSEGAEK